MNILDVRRRHEFEESHIEGALNVPIHEILRRLDEVPAGEVWVHCGGGYRASIVASILAANGHRLSPSTTPSASTPPPPACPSWVPSPEARCSEYTPRV